MEGRKGEGKEGREKGRKEGGVIDGGMGEEEGKGLVIFGSRFKGIQRTMAGKGWRLVALRLQSGSGGS